jgi:hypothetical protein
MNFASICRAIFCLRKEPSGEVIPAEGHLNIDFQDKNGTLVFSWAYHEWTIHAPDLCHDFRNGKGYEYIDHELDMLYASGGVLKDTCDQLRAMLRAWGHANETRY